MTIDDFWAPILYFVGFYKSRLSEFSYNVSGKESGVAARYKDIKHFLVHRTEKNLHGSVHRLNFIGQKMAYLIIRLIYPNIFVRICAGS